MTEMLKIIDLSKHFTLHLKGGMEIAVFDKINLTLQAGDAMALTGSSGAGKSSFLKLIYGSYLASDGQILVRHKDRWIDIANATPREIIALRKQTIGYVSQFLRVIPRVPTLDIVAEPLIERGTDSELAKACAMEILGRLNIPEQLWSLSPVTFSGGEQQRVNIARGLIAPHPILLLDEPTASLDAENRDVVLKLINEARANGSAIIGIFHSADDRDAVCTTQFDVQNYKDAA